MPGEINISCRGVQVSSWSEISLALVFFGVRSPLVVDYEETCIRSGIDVSMAISLGDPVRAVHTLNIRKLEDLNLSQSDSFIPCAFGPARRRELYVLATARGLHPAEALIDATAIVALSARIGLCSYVNAGVVIAGLCLLGTGVLVNRSASIGHHTMIDDFVSIGPGAVLTGNLRIGSDVLIGAGAVIHPNLTIGAGATVAAGAVVRASVESGTTVAGNPARPVRTIASRSSVDRDE